MKTLNCKLPETFVSTYTSSVSEVKAAEKAGVPLWSGTKAPPAIGSTVWTAESGAAIVLDYFTAHGYLGLTVENQRTHRVSDVYGAELRGGETMGA